MRAIGHMLTCAAFVCIASTSTVRAQSNSSTVGAPDAIRCEPNCIGDLAVVGNDFVLVLAKHGYYVYDQSGGVGDRVTIPEYLAADSIGFGIRLQNMHGSDAGKMVEDFDDENERSDAYTWYKQHTSLDVYTAESPAGTYGICITQAQNGAKFYSFDTFVIDGGCYQYSAAATAWPDARCVVAWNYTVTSGTVKSELGTVSSRMNGNQGLDYRVLAMAVTGTTLSFTGDMNTILSPSVYEVRNFTEGGTFRTYLGISVIFDGDLDTSIPASDVVYGYGAFGVFGAQWVSPHQINATLWAVTSGIGWLYISTFNPSIGAMDGGRSAQNSIGLDADGINGRSATSFLMYCQADNPWSLCTGVSVVQQSDGVHVKWLIDQEGGTIRYRLSKADSWTGTFTVFDSVSATGGGWYEVTDRNRGSANVYRVTDVDSLGIETVQGDDAVREPFVMPEAQLVPYCDVDSLRAVLEAERPPERSYSPEEILPIFEHVMFMPRVFVEYAQPVADELNAEGHISQIVALEDIGGVAGVKPYLANAVPYGLRCADLVGWNTDKSYWSIDALWIAAKNWYRQDLPVQPQRDVFRLQYIVDTTYVQALSLGSFTPYYATTDSIADVDGDGKPDVALSTVPVGTAAEVSSWAAKTVTELRTSHATAGVTIFAQARTFNGNSGSRVAEIAAEVAASYPAGTSVRQIVDIDAAPMDYATREAIFDSDTSVVAELLGTLANRNRWHFAEVTSGFSWTKHPVNRAKRYVKIWDCEGGGPQDRTRDPNFPGTILEDAIARFPGQGPVWACGPSRGSFIEANRKAALTYNEIEHTTGGLSASDILLRTKLVLMQDSTLIAYARSLCSVGCSMLRMPGQVYATTGVPGANVGQLGFSPPYPNPTRGRATIRFSLAERSTVNLSVYDLQGRKTVELINSAVDAGIRSLTWTCTDGDGRPVSPGIYLVRLRAGNRSLVQRMIVLR